MASRARIVIAGGGTGGHVFPGLAIADALRAIADVDVIFVGTARGMEARVIPERGYRLELLDVVPMRGGGVTRAVRGAAIAARETLRALRLAHRLAPRVVVSVGGYAAGPMALAAAALAIPIALVEPNSVVGLANRILSPFAARAYIAWDEAASGFRAKKTRAYGVPLRAGFGPKPYLASGASRLLLLGGSQGARALNERVPEAVARAARSVPELEVVHQAGKADTESVRSTYARLGFTRASVVPFLEDVAAEIARADVVLARAGAGTLGEVAAIGRAALLVPFPHAAGDHQAENALAFERAGAAVCVRQHAADATRLSSELLTLFGSNAARTRMADAARAFGRPSAAHDIAQDLLAIAGVEKRPTPKASRNGASRSLPEAR